VWKSLLSSSIGVGLIAVSVLTLGGFQSLSPEGRALASGNENDSRRRRDADSGSRLECVGYNTSVGPAAQAELFVYRQSGGDTNYKVRWYRFDGTMAGEQNGEIDSGQVVLATTANPEIVRARVSVNDGYVIVSARMNSDRTTNIDFVRVPCFLWFED
jgi:hypothetical protein